MPTGLPASYSTSPGAPAISVLLQVRERHLYVESETVRRDLPLESLRLAPGSSGPVTIWFPDGARVVVPDRAAFTRLLATSPGAAIQMSQWDSSARPMLAPLAIVLVVIVGLLIGAYRFAIPAVSEEVTERIPASVATAVSESTLATLERENLSPSGLPAARQEQLETAFEALQPGSRGRYRLLFRKSDALGPNALALPSGTIVVTDALVGLARDDREILGVLAHEAGHVDRRHGLRLVVQGSLMSLVAGWVVGDYTSIIAAAPAALLEAKYSRDFEREADAYAADLMLANGISPSALADMLERIDRSVRAAGDTPKEHSGFSMLDYASSHPATAERLAYLRDRR